MFATALDWTILWNKLIQSIHTRYIHILISFTITFSIFFHLPLGFRRGVSVQLFFSKAVYAFSTLSRVLHALPSNLAQADCTIPSGEEKKS
jgi:hypothetical protein